MPTLTTPFRTPSPNIARSPDPTRFPRVSSRRTPEPSRLRSSGPSRHRTPEARARSPTPREHLHERTPSRPFTPAHRSRPFTPHDEAPSPIQPIPVRNASPSIFHRPFSVPPDNWIPLAQDANGDGRLSIHIPPPHELGDRVQPQEQFTVTQTPEQGSPDVQMHDVAPTPVPPRANNIRHRDYAYERGPAQAPMPQRIAQAASNNSRASTHLSEYELLGPLEDRYATSSMGVPPPPVMEEDELEYIDPPPDARVAPPPPAPVLMQQSEPPAPAPQPQIRRRTPEDVRFRLSVFLLEPILT